MDKTCDDYMTTAPFQIVTADEHEFILGDDGDSTDPLGSTEPEESSVVESALLLSAGVTDDKKTIGGLMKLEDSENRDGIIKLQTFIKQEELFWADDDALESELDNYSQADCDLSADIITSIKQEIKSESEHILEDLVKLPSNPLNDHHANIKQENVCKKETNPEVVKPTSSNHRPKGEAGEDDAEINSDDDNRDDCPSPSLAGDYSGDTAQEVHISEAMDVSESTGLIEPDDISSDEDEKPTNKKSSEENALRKYTCADFIALALLSEPSNSAPTKKILKYISENFPEFCNKEKNWNIFFLEYLNRSKYFVQVGELGRSPNTSWTFQPGFEKKLLTRLKIKHNFNVTATANMSSSNKSQAGEPLPTSTAEGQPRNPNEPKPAKTPNQIQDAKKRLSTESVPPNNSEVQPGSSNFYNSGFEKGRLYINRTRDMVSQDVNLQVRNNKESVNLLPRTKKDTIKTIGLLQKNNQNIMPKIVPPMKLVKCSVPINSVLTANSVISLNNQHPVQAFINLPSTMAAGTPIINKNNFNNSISNVVNPILVATNETLNPSNTYAFNPATGLIQLSGNILYFNQPLNSPQLLPNNTIFLQNNVLNTQSDISINQNKQNFIPIVSKTGFSENAVPQIGVINGSNNSVQPLMLLNNSQNAGLVVNNSVEIEKSFNKSSGNIKKTLVFYENNKTSVVPQIKKNMKINQNPPLAHKSVLPKQENISSKSNTKQISDGKQKFVAIAPRPQATSFIEPEFEEKMVQSAESSTRNVSVKHYKCKICNIPFPTLDDITAHVNHHITHTCFECKVTFSMESALVNHKLVEHAFNKCDIRNCRHRVCHQYAIVDAPDSSQCHKCSAMFEDNEALLNHHCNAANEVDKTSSKESSRINKLFKCLVCFKTYKERTYVVKHLKEDHKDVGRISCNDCRRTFKKKKNLREHINKVHTLKHKCEICSRMFSTLHKLKIHLSNQHLIEKRKIFVCNVCGKTLKYLKSRKTIKQHLLTHTSEKPYVCEECGKSFRTQSNLYQHQRTHSKNRPFSCAMCDKTFRIKNHLNQHMTVHGKVSTSTVRKRKRIQTSSNSENEEIEPYNS